MNYKIFDKNGNEVNRIFCDEDFAIRYCELNGYTYEAEESAAEAAPEIVLTPAEQREQAYNTERLIEWDGDMLTVTEAATLWQYYAAEGSAKAGDLTALIVEAKATIREKYPDNE